VADARLSLSVPASHLNWQGKRPLTQASYPTLDAALCGIKVNSRRAHPEPFTPVRKAAKKRAAEAQTPAAMWTSRLEFARSL